MLQSLKKGEINYQQIRELAKYANNAGVTLAIENGNMGISSQVDILRQIVDCCGIKVCVDVGHAHCVSENSHKYFLEEFAGEIVHFHFSDNDGSSDQHLVPGAGNIAWGRLLARLKKMNFVGQCVLELNTANARQAVHHAREYLMAIADTNNEIV